MLVDEGQEYPGITLRGSGSWFHKQYTAEKGIYYLKSSQLSRFEYSSKGKWQKGAVFVNSLLTEVNKYFDKSIRHAQNRKREIKEIANMSPLDRFLQAIEAVDPLVNENRECPLCYSEFLP